MCRGLIEPYSSRLQHIIRPTDLELLRLMSGNSRVQQELRAFPTAPPKSLPPPNVFPMCFGTLYSNNHFHCFSFVLPQLQTSLRFLLPPFLLSRLPNLISPQSIQFSPVTPVTYLICIPLASTSLTRFTFSRALHARPVTATFHPTCF